MLEKLSDVLSNLMWNKYEISIYCALVKYGVMKPTELVVHAGLSQDKLYTVLNQLIIKGAIVKLESSKYDAQNPQYVLENLIENVEKKKKNALNEAKQVYEKRYENGINNSKCYAISGVNGISTQIRTLMSECKKSLKICDIDLSWINNSERKIINRLVRDGKQISILSSYTYKEELIDLQEYGVLVKTNNFSSSYYLFDDKKVLLRFNSPDSCILITDNEFVKTKVIEFEKEFKKGKNIQTERLELKIK